MTAAARKSGRKRLHKRREDADEYDALRRAEAIEQGLCTSCRREPASEGRRRCDRCRAAAAAREAKRRSEARERGLCEACRRRKAATGRGGRCNACADKYLPAQLERDREARKRRNAERA